MWRQGLDWRVAERFSGASLGHFGSVQPEIADYTFETQNAFPYEKFGHPKNCVIKQHCNTVIYCMMFSAQLVQYVTSSKPDITGCGGGQGETERGSPPRETKQYDGMENSCIPMDGLAMSRMPPKTNLTAEA